MIQFVLTYKKKKQKMIETPIKMQELFETYFEKTVTYENCLKKLMY